MQDPGFGAWGTITMMTETQIRERLERIRYCAEVGRHDGAADAEEADLLWDFLKSLSDIPVPSRLGEVLNSVALVLQCETIKFERYHR